MNTNKSNSEYHHKSAYASNEDLLSLSITAALLLKFCLFNKGFTTKQMIPLINQVLQFLQRDHKRYENYMELCQRVLLAREMEIKSCRPAYWFKKHFDKTGLLYVELLEKRKTHPLFRHGLKWLAEGMLDLWEDVDEAKINYWMSWFKDNNAVFEMRIFKRAVKFITVNNKRR